MSAIAHDLELAVTDREQLTIEGMSSGTLTTSIEGEILDRAQV